MRRIVIRPVQLFDMQYLGPQVRLLLATSVGTVVPGDQVITLRYGHWLVKTVDPIGYPRVTAIGVVADLLEDAALIDPITPADHGRGSAVGARPSR